MEYLEGETLSDRLSRGPLPTEHVLRYGIEIAGALSAARRRGIVHRDLKPGNVILTKSGAKLLDFGSAKNVAADFSPPQSETQKKPLTEEGTVLGTVQYMAPEQLEGREADARTDIFALGAMLYEMATGKRAFEGKSRASENGGDQARGWPAACPAWPTATFGHPATRPTTHLGPQAWASGKGTAAFRSSLQGDRNDVRGNLTIVLNWRAPSR